MTIQTIGVGSSYNDKTGDKVRDAFIKVNSNFTESENAASRLVQSSPTDTTAGRLMAVGAFGLGVTDLPDQPGLNADDINVLGWNYASSPVNGPLSGTTRFFTIPSTVGGGRGIQWAYPVNVSTIYYRIQSSSSTWSAWQPVYTGANYQPETSLGIGVVRLMLNNSGGTISNTGTIAGASLLNVRFNADLTSWSGGIAPTGTWKQVFGVSLAAGETGYFVRIA